MNASNAAVGGGCDRLAARRVPNVGGSVQFYRRPTKMVLGRGSWLDAADAARYLDFFNNVASATTGPACGSCSGT